MNAVQPPQVSGDTGVSDEEDELQPFQNGKHGVTVIPAKPTLSDASTGTASTVRSMETKLNNRSIE
jgi:hypothetical protein